MRLAIGVAAAAVLAGAGLLHGYWATRANGSLKGFVPEVNGAPAFRPTRGQTVAVAAALAVGTALVVSALGAPLGVPVVLARVGCAGMALVFAARSIGDFRLVGIFKRVRGTTFAVWDDRLFTPLFAALSLATMVVAVG